MDKDYRLSRRAYIIGGAVFGVVIVQVIVDALRLFGNCERVQNNGIRHKFGAAVYKGKLLCGLFRFFVGVRVQYVNYINRANVAHGVVKVRGHYFAQCEFCPVAGKAQFALRVYKII